MKLTLFVLIFLPLVAFSQDYIELKSGEIFNCKILSETKDEVKFLIDSIGTKKVPLYLVKSVNYNQSAPVVNYDFKKNIAIKDTVTQPSSEPLVINKSNISIAKSLNGAAVALSIITTGLLVYNVTLRFPSPPNNLNDYAAASNYSEDIYDYLKQKQFIYDLSFATGSTALLLGVLAQTSIIKELDTKRNISFKSSGTSASICLRF